MSQPGDVCWAKSEARGSILEMMQKNRTTANYTTTDPGPNKLIEASVAPQPFSEPFPLANGAVAWAAIRSPLTATL